MFLIINVLHISYDDAVGQYGMKYYIFSIKKTPHQLYIIWSEKEKHFIRKECKKQIIIYGYLDSTVTTLLNFITFCIISLPLNTK